MCFISQCACMDFIAWNLAMHNPNDVKVSTPRHPARNHHWAKA